MGLTADRKAGVKVADDFREQVEAVLAGEDVDDLLGVVIDLSLAAEDRVWAQECLLELAIHEHTDVRGNALMGFAHLAARFGAIDRDQVEPALHAALADDKAHVREQAEACLEELGWGPPQSGVEG